MFLSSIFKDYIMKTLEVIDEFTFKTIYIYNSISNLVLAKMQFVIISACHSAPNCLPDKMIPYSIFQ